MSGPTFENVYKDKLWRIGMTEYRGHLRLAIWAYYLDRQTEDWRPCGGKGNTHGCIIPIERVQELSDVLAEIAAQLSHVTKAAA